VVLAAFLAMLLTGSMVTVLAQAQGSTIDGSISKLNGMTLRLAQGDGGTKAVTLRSDTLVLARQRTTLRRSSPSTRWGSPPGVSRTGR
jgi:hypothetical protein